MLIADITYYIIHYDNDDDEDNGGKIKLMEYIYVWNVILAHCIVSTVYYRAITIDINRNKSHQIFPLAVNLDDIFINYYICFTSELNMWLHACYAAYYF